MELERTEIEEEEAAAPMEDRVYVALPEEYKRGKASLVWVLKSASKNSTIIITHVHAPPQMIPLMGTKFPASQLRPEQVNAYRKQEREKVDKHLDEYLYHCRKAKFKAEKLVLEKADVAEGILELITDHGIIKLVVGAAADNHFSKKMKEPKSKTAITLMDKAAVSCKIWFVCNGNLICTRDAPTASFNQSEQLRCLSLPPVRSVSLNSSASSQIDILMQRTRSEAAHSLDGGVGLGLPQQLDSQSQMSPWSRLTPSSLDSWDRNTRMSFQSSDWAPTSLTDDVGSIGAPSMHGPSEKEDDVGSYADVCAKLQAALQESRKLKNEASDEYFRRVKAESDLASALQRAKKLEDSHIQERDLARERQEREIELLKCQQDETMKKILADRIVLERKVVASDLATTDLEDKLAAVRYLLDSLQAEYDQLLCKHENTVRELEGLRNQKEVMNSEFSLVELQQATQNFNDSNKIGEGGFGRVYKGSVRNTTVAIKILHSQSLQGRAQFEQEVAILTRVRHPNLVTLIGACSEASALVYELLPNGSLEDRLACTGNTPPLTWQVRTRIIGEICSALIFLHSNKPHPVVHGDLKPANILLDANLISKLGDFGISQLMIRSNTTTLYRTTNPKGTFAYMDPEFLTTGELTLKSDVYSFGIIILRLLTGKQPLRIVDVVEEAVEKGGFGSVVDVSSGDWPLDQVERLAGLGLRCANLRRKKRPNLVSEVWTVMEPLINTALLSAASLAPRHYSSTPSYFTCPIRKEIMRDPQIAADGYTYEAEAIRGWFFSGYKTSPKTNLALAHLELIPNHALHSAIQDWLQQS